MAGARVGCVGLAVVVAASLASPAQAGARYELDVSVDAKVRTLDGTVQVDVVNRGTAPLATVWLWRYPERFAARSPALNDFNLHWVYPGSFNPGGMTTGEVLVDGKPAASEVVDHARAGRRALLRVVLPRPLAPGERARVSLAFAVRIPERFGRFGCFRGTCTLGGGFYPMLAGFDERGVQDLAAPPERADYRVTVRVPRASDVLVSGELRTAAAGESLTVELARAPSVALLVGPPRLRKTVDEHRGVRLVLYSAAPRPLPSAPGQVLPYLPPDRGTRMLATAREAIDLLAESGAPLEPGSTVRLVEGALRVELATALPGFVLVSDQAFAIFPLERFLKFHEFELARAIYASLLDGKLAARERPGDLGWSPEVAAQALVDRYTVRAYRRQEWASQILKWASFIPAIDRILYAPQVPFASAYFYTLEDSDPLRDSLAQFNNDRPQGKLIYAKLRDLLGDAGISEITRRQLDGEPLRAAAEAVRNQSLDWFFTQWLAPYPKVDYRFADVRSERRGARWLHLVVVEKRGDRPPREPVEVRARDKTGAVLVEKWDGAGLAHTYEFDMAGPLSSIEIDPRGRLVEDLPGSNDDLRFDDRRPPRWKFVYNNFGGLVQVFPTFALDLSLDFSLAPILDVKNAFRFVLYHTTSTQIGLLASYTRSFGRKITARLTQAITPSLSISRLDPSFGRAIGAGENPGTRLSAGVGWGYDDRLFVWEPSRALSLGAGVSYGLTVLDSGVALSTVTLSVGGEAIVPLADLHGLAFLATAGVGFGDFRLPSQMIGAGGAGGLRGYGVDEILGRLRLLWRAEYRHVFVHSLDWNILHAFYVRGIGGGLFVEGAYTSSCSSYSLGAESLAADVGYSLRIFGDWLGVAQTTLNLDFGVPLTHPRRECLGDPNSKAVRAEAPEIGRRSPLGFFFAFGAPW